MKLNIVPARTGTQWVKSGMQTFFRQPLALSGLFFMFLALLSVVSIVPLAGGVLALVLLPAATLGFMAATQEATRGKFPMPTILISAFRAGQQRLRSMLVLGVLYAAGFGAIMAVSSLADGGKFARLYLMGGEISTQVVTAPDFQTAMWIFVALYLPLSLMFWHAPALVHWHGVPPVKALFFSVVACMRNFGAFTVYGLTWVAVFVGGSMVISLFAVLIGSPQAAAMAMLPAALLLAAIFFTSVYFTFRDCFVADDAAADDPAPAPPTPTPGDAP